MIKSFRRVFGVVRRHRFRFVVSQVMMFIAAVSTVGYATLIAPLVNQGMVEGDAEAALRIGFWMLVLAVIIGISMTIAASQAVYFSQGTAYVLRRFLYEKVQRYSFENFDHFPTGKLMVRLNADVVNVQNAMQQAIMLGSYAPFMLLATIVLAAINTPGLLWILAVVVVAVIVLMAVLIPAVDKAYKERQRRLWV